MTVVANSRRAAARNHPVGAHPARHDAVPADAHETHEVTVAPVTAGRPGAGTSRTPPSSSCRRCRAARFPPRGSPARRSCCSRSPPAPGRGGHGRTGDR